MQPTSYRGTAARPVPPAVPRQSPGPDATQEIIPVRDIAAPRLQDAPTQEIPRPPEPRGGRPGILRRGLPWTALVGGVLVVGIIAGIAVVALRGGTRPVTGTGGEADAGDIAAGNNVKRSASPSPAPSPVIALPASYTIPGGTPKLTWPRRGQAALAVSGLGTVGLSGAAKAVPIASVTKVMTAYVILRDHPLDAGESGPHLTVTAAEAAAYPGQVAQHQSLVPVAAGEVLTERQALEALLLPSADNIAQILARWDAGTPARFVTKMTAMAARLGMKHTRYTDPSGLSATTKSTAADQVLLGQRAMTVPALAGIVAMSSATIPVAGRITNYNSLLGDDGFVGIKTGSTSAAGGCLLFAVQREVGGHQVLVVGAVLGQTGGSLYGLSTALSKSEKLVSSLFTVLDEYTVVSAGQLVAEVGGTRLVAEKDVTVLGWPGRRYQLKPHLTSATAGTLTVTPPAPEAPVNIALTTN
jgi:D-alanyl-D-alanine carboxypeptidase (penicillin-binding protein 5/6)